MNSRDLFQTLRTLVDTGIANESKSSSRGFHPDEGRISLFKTEGGWCCKVYTQLLSVVTDEHIFLDKTEEGVLEKAVKHFNILVDITEDNVYAERYGQFKD